MCVCVCVCVCVHITSNWIIDLNVRGKTIKLININLEKKSSQSNINK